jgi:hypothetical protein
MALAVLSATKASTGKAGEPNTRGAMAALSAS